MIAVLHHPLRDANSEVVYLTGKVLTNVVPEGNGYFRWKEWHIRQRSLTFPRKGRFKVCPACAGRGWVLLGGSAAIEFEPQRCDLCQKFPDDMRATMAILKSDPQFSLKKLTLERKPWNRRIG